MKVYKCDRCKKEFNSTFQINKVRIGTLLVNEYELCEDCMKEFSDFFKGENLK